MTAELSSGVELRSASSPVVLTRRHPLEGRRATLEALTGEPSITLEPLVSAVDLRVDPDGGAPEAIAAALGGTLPRSPDTWTELPDGVALRLGPDEWLLTSAAADPHRWEDRVDALAAPHGGMAVDVSAQRVGLRLHGPAARDLLAFGCSIDLRPTAFGRGRCAQTLFGQAAVLLVAHAEDDLRLHVRTSFAGYVVDRLVDTARSLRPTPA
ncbi:sarcosine oxidase subunit gamma family protein [Actinomycetospora sp. NBRC 106378]|uniref:sarcosine oxidase subunit gamma n=1 Tax=Actinomycetospora sp. NBRC 106378 TaxID=3032208 RepID=UPI0024A4D6D3|nr:sarcosine oxidase subunit gamma family protein [Actinomycetospora sp. NBRC 106378]GLZ54644.1 sarcosine oxidase subunit gamma [Actinomycetospora sp. NBRC 106378]